MGRPRIIRSSASKRSLLASYLTIFQLLQSTLPPNLHVFNCTSSRLQTIGISTFSLTSFPLSHLPRFKDALILILLAPDYGFCEYQSSNFQQCTLHLTRQIAHIRMALVTAPASLFYHRWVDGRGPSELTSHLQQRPPQFNNQGYLPNGAAAYNGPPPGAAPLLPNNGRIIQQGGVRVLCVADVRGR